MKWTLKLQLPSKLLLAIVPIITASLLTLGWIVYTQLKANSEQDLVQRMDMLLIQTQNQTRSYINTAVANAGLFAGSDLMQRYAVTENEADRYDLMQPALLQLFSSYRKAYPEYREIRYLLPDGFEDTRLADPGLENISEEEGDSPWFQAMDRTKNQQPFFNDVYRSSETGGASLLVVKPIRLKDRDVEPIRAKRKLRGFLAITADMDFLHNIISSQKIGESGHLVALTSDGQEFFQNHEQHGNGKHNHQKLFELFSNQKKLDKPEPFLLDDELIYVRGRWVHDNLLLLAMVPNSEFAAASRQISKTVTAVTLGAILLSSLLLYWLLRILVLQPISTLRESAIAIGEGKLDTRIAVKKEREDQIGDLANAFREMRGKLGDSMHNLQESHKEIETLANRDALTGLPNRRLFLELLEKAVSKAGENSGELAVMFLDLDDFKKVNDTIGHDAGDLLLQEVAERLLECVKGDKVIAAEDHERYESEYPVARLGGDEFTIMLSDQHGEDHVTALAKEIIASLTRPIVLNEQEFTVGTSIGIATYPVDATDVSGLLKCADSAMYEAKENQKNTYRHYDGVMHMGIQRRTRLENDMRTALDRQDFSLKYQLQYSARSGEIVGVEALMRWHHPQEGLIEPDVFIPIAEDSGFICQLGEWGLNEACRQWREWQDQGIADLRMAVNISQRQFGLSDVDAAIHQAMSQNNIGHGVLQLEITESSMMEVPKEVVATLSNLRSKGVLVAMDHFGTGYSSLSSLTSLPIDTLKIDRSFISDIKLDSPGDDIVSAVLTLARTLKLEIVAEGVETQGQLDYLNQRECDIVQGFIFSLPMAPGELFNVLSSHHVRSSKKAG